MVRREPFDFGGTNSAGELTVDGQGASHPIDAVNGHG
jgi:hypothetical protein